MHERVRVCVRARGVCVLRVYMCVCSVVRVSGLCVCAEANKCA